MKNKNPIIAIIIFLAVTSGCRQISSKADVDFINNKDDLKTAVEAVKKKLGVSFNLLEVEITKNQFKIQIETTGDPQKRAEYTYSSGVLSETTPPEHGEKPRVYVARIPFQEFDFTVVEGIVKNALEKTRIEGGKVINLHFLKHAAHIIGWIVKIQGTNENATVNADIAGNIVYLDLSETARGLAYKAINQTELNKAAAAIKSRFGSDAHFSDILIDQQAVLLKAVSEENANMLDTFSFDESGLQKMPFPLFFKNSSGEPFAFNGIDLNDSINLLQRTKDTLKMPDVEDTTIIVRYAENYSEADANKQSAEKQRVVWTVRIKSGLNSGIVEYDDKLNELSVKKD